MRACGRCGHPNAAHLKYCFSCGRRLDQAPITTTTARAAYTAANADGPGGSARQTAETALALTVAVKHPHRAATTPSDQRSTYAPSPPPEAPAFVAVPRQVWAALRYVFTYARGRLDAETRKRHLIGERDGTQRLKESVLFGLGQIIVAAGDMPPELAGLGESVAQSRLRRDAAISDGQATEKLQASEDLRLGLEQSRAETEWKACEKGAVEVDSSLRNLEEQRREVDGELQRATSATAPAAPASAVTADRRAALEEQRTQIDERYRSLRERAAALRAATMAARSKFEHATAARRQAALEMTASVSAHARDRSEAEQTIRELTVELGRTAHQLRLPQPALLPSYAHISRLESIIQERDVQLGGLQQTAGAYDRRKLALGMSLLAAAVAALTTATWLLLR